MRQICRILMLSIVIYCVTIRLNEENIEKGSVEVYDHDEAKKILGL